MHRLRSCLCRAACFSSRVRAVHTVACTGEGKQRLLCSNSCGGARSDDVATHERASHAGVRFCRADAHISVGACAQLLSRRWVASAKTAKSKCQKKMPSQVSTRDARLGEHMLSPSRTAPLHTQQNAKAALHARKCRGKTKGELTAMSVPDLPFGQDPCATAQKAKRVSEQLRTPGEIKIMSPRSSLRQSQVKRFNKRLAAIARLWREHSRGTDHTRA